jgi:hypothetical protein
MSSRICIEQPSHHFSCVYCIAGHTHDLEIPSPVGARALPSLVEIIVTSLIFKNEDNNIAFLPEGCVTIL